MAHPKYDKVCSYCGAKGLKWDKSDGKWVLKERTKTGKPVEHRCLSHKTPLYDAFDAGQPADVNHLMEECTRASTHVVSDMCREWENLNIPPAGIEA